MSFPYAKIIYISAIILSLVGLIHFINVKLHLPDDNPIEQAIEKMIEEETGFDIDLTPENEEDDPWLNQN